VVTTASGFIELVSIYTVVIIHHLPHNSTTLLRGKELAQTQQIRAKYSGVKHGSIILHETGDLIQY